MTPTWFTWFTWFISTPPRESNKVFRQWPKRTMRTMRTMYDCQSCEDSLPASLHLEALPVPARPFAGLVEHPRSTAGVARVVGCPPLLQCGGLSWPRGVERQKIAIPPKGAANGPTNVGANPREIVSSPGRSPYATELQNGQRRHPSPAGDLDLEDDAGPVLDPYSGSRAWRDREDDDELDARKGQP